MKVGVGGVHESGRSAAISAASGCRFGGWWLRRPSLPRAHRAGPREPGQIASPREQGFRPMVGSAEGAKAQQMAAHESPRTTKLYDRRNDVVSLDEVEKVVF
jgi:hypothetical protein